MSKYHLYLNIWFLVCVVISPPLLWETMFHDLFHIDKNFFFRDEMEIVTSCVFTSAYVLFPLFFIYQIILKFNKKLNKINFKLNLISFVIWLLSILLYAWFIQVLDRAIEKAHRASEKVESQYNEK